MAKGQSLQDPYLNALRKERVPVSIFLVNMLKTMTAPAEKKSFPTIQLLQLSRLPSNGGCIMGTGCRLLYLFYY